MPRAAGKAGTVRIGLSGWSYAPWRGRFYPRELPRRAELAYAAHRFRTIEINATFYRLQRPEHFARWAGDTPADFIFALKGPRFVTHMLKMKDAETPLANFFASGVLRLGAKLGPVLWQFPARMRYDETRLEAFLALLPHDTERALRLARRHDRRVDDRAWLKVDAARPIRHALEIRNESFCCTRFVRQLRRFGVALVVADTVEWPLKMDLTADFLYCRLHGSRELYVSGYSDVEIDCWARRIKAWARGGEPCDAMRISEATKPRARGRDVFVYFDNDAKVRAPRDAAALMQCMGVPAAIP